MTDVLYDLRVKHTKTNPVFVVGCARSGTSILIRLIRKYLKINFGTETQFIIRYFKNLNRYGDLKRDENLKLLITDLSKERCFQRWKKRFNFELNSNDIFNEMINSNHKDLKNNVQRYVATLESIFHQFAKYHRMERWGDKTPEYILNMPILKELFPEAQFIHIIRDGRDVALSTFQTPFGAGNIYKAAQDWKHKVLNVQAFSRNVNKSQLCEIRYEDVMNDPVTVFKELIIFLKIEDTEEELLEFVEQNIRNDLKISNTMKWKKLLNKKDQILFEKIAGYVLETYGYECQNNKIASLSLTERIYWNIDNILKKWSDKRYWKDNMYKLKQKFKGIIFPLHKMYQIRIKQ